MGYSVNDLTTADNIDYSCFPDARGHFGVYGGRFVSETLISALDQLAKMYQRLKDDAGFQAEFDKDMAHYVGRPSPLYHAERWSREIGGAQIYLKREDLNHTGAHKVNNTIGQALLAKGGWPRVAGERQSTPGTRGPRLLRPVRLAHTDRLASTLVHPCWPCQDVEGRSSVIDAVMATPAPRSGKHHESAARRFGHR